MIEILLLCYFIYQLVKEFYLRKRLSSNGHLLKGKRVIITGASSGIGKQLAFQYAKHGADIVLASRTKAKLDEVADECKRLGGGGQVHVVPTDVSVASQNQSLIDASVRLLEGIDVLLLNAGQGDDLEKFRDQAFGAEKWKQLMDVNFWACVTLTQAALPHLETSHGQVLVVSSLAGEFHPPGRTGYCPSKAAVNSFFTSVRYEVGDKIDITLACPGYVITEIHNGALARGQQRDMSKFITAEECAVRVIEAGINKDRKRLLTTLSRVANYVQPFFPPLIQDWLLRRQAEVFRDAKKDQ